MTTDESIDELIFDYLEGNLSAEEREAVELLMSESETFNAEVLQWKQTYLSETLPAIESLQRKLLIPTSHDGDIGRRFYVSVALLLFLSFVSLDVPNKTEVKRPVESKDMHEARAIVLSVPITVNKPVIACEASASRPVSVSKKPNADQSQVSALRYTKAQAALFEMRPLPAMEVSMPGAARVAIIAGPQPNRVATVTVRSMLSKKQMRALRRKRRNAEAMKMIPFQPGNVPYVVPLDTRNF